MEEEKDMCCQHDHGAKKFLAPIGALVLLLLGAYLFGLIRNSWKAYDYIGRTPDVKNQITIDGTGKVAIKPDIALVSLGIITEKSSVGDAQRDNTTKMNAITKAMKENFQIDDKDIQTQQYSISPRYDWSSNVQRIIGYTVTQTLSIKVRNFDKIGDILAKAGDLGANNIQGPNFTIDDPSAAREQARNKAIIQAKDKAKVLASQLGIRLGPIVNFYEGTSLPMINYYRSDAMMGGVTSKEVSAPAPDIQPGSEEVSVTVSISYEIK